MSWHRARQHASPYVVAAVAMSWMFAVDAANIGAQTEKLPDIPIGINIGKSRTTPIEQATEDYLHSFRLLREFADYVALNVSSPNTPGLRELQEPQKLSELLRAIRNEPDAAAKPLLIKISPDLSSGELESLLKVCGDNGAAGIIATNTTLDHSSVLTELDQPGGLSGVPLCAKSMALLREITTRSSVPVIACGGIRDAESARQKFQAGAALIQESSPLIQESRRRPVGIGPYPQSRG